MTRLNIFQVFIFSFLSIFMPLDLFAATVVVVPAESTKRKGDDDKKQEDGLKRRRVDGDQCAHNGDSKVEGVKRPPALDFSTLPDHNTFRQLKNRAVETAQFRIILPDIKEAITKDAVDLLEEHKEFMTRPMIDKFFLLHYAIYSHAVKSVRFLLNCGANYLLDGPATYGSLAPIEMCYSMPSKLAEEQNEICKILISFYLADEKQEKLIEALEKLYDKLD